MQLTIEIPDQAVPLIEASGRKADTWAVQVVHDAYLSLIRKNEEDAIDAARQLRLTQKLGEAITAWDPFTEVTVAPAAQPA